MSAFQFEFTVKLWEYLVGWTSFVLLIWWIICKITDWFFDFGKGGKDGKDDKDCGTRNNANGYVIDADAMRNTWTRPPDSKK